MGFNPVQLARYTIINYSVGGTSYIGYFHLENQPSVIGIRRFMMVGDIVMNS